MSEGSNFRLRTEWELPVLEVLGEIDIANAQEFAAVLDRAVSARPALVVSLDDTSYFDSKGIHVLLMFAGRLSRSDQRLALVAKAGTAPRRLLEIANVPTVVPTYGSIEEAVTAIAQLGLLPPFQAT